jgi:hypothetical protein
MNVGRIVILVAAALLAACATRPSEPGHAPSARPADVRGRVEAIDAHLAKDRKTIGHWRQDDAASTFQAYFQRNRLEYVVETAGGNGAQGYAVNKYYYGGGKLFYYRGQGSAAGTENSKPVEIDLQLAFDDQGRLVRAAKTVNGRQAQLAPGEAEAIHRHASDLRRRARAESSGGQQSAS